MSTSSGCRFGMLLIWALVAMAVLICGPVWDAGLAWAEEDHATAPRTLAPSGPDRASSDAAAPGYCASAGGSHLYEYIADVSYVQMSENTLAITVIIYIANPTGCTYGNPCPEYDASPEFVNAWIDWNGNQTFDGDERVLDAALTGYLGINYHGSMSTSSIVTIPEGALGSTWMRVNLGWDHDPNNPCEYAWTWGDVVDSQVELDAEIEDFRILGGLSQYDGKYEDLVFRRGPEDPNPKFEVDVAGAKSKVEIDILRGGTRLATLDAAYNPGKDMYVAIWSDWESDAWSSIPNDIPVGEYSAVAKIVAEDGSPLDTSEERSFYVIFEVPAGLGHSDEKAFLYDDHGYRDEIGVWFGSIEQPVLGLFRRGLDYGKKYYLHPYSERIFDIAIEEVEGQESQDLAAMSLSRWAQPYGWPQPVYVGPSKGQYDANCNYVRTGDYICCYWADDPLPEGWNFKYSTCHDSRDTHALLDRADKYAQCADSANLLAALLRSIGIPAHPVTADADESKAIWHFDTWIEALISGTWTAFHPHEKLGPSTRSAAGVGWGGLSNEAMNDIIIMGGPNWNIWDLDDIWIPLLHDDHDVLFDYEDGSPTNIWKRAWVENLSSDYWGAPAVLASSGPQPVPGHDNLTTELTLDESEYSVGETVTIDFKIVNSSNKNAPLDFSIQVVADDPLTMIHGDELVTLLEQHVTVQRNDSLVINEQYVLPYDLSVSDLHYVRAVCDGDISDASFVLNPLYDIAASVPEEVVLASSVEFPVSCEITNNSVETLYSLEICLQGSYNLNVPVPCATVAAIGPHSSATLNWTVEAVKSGIGTLEFEVASANGGNSTFSRNVSILSGVKLDIVDQYIGFEAEPGDPVDVDFSVRNFGGTDAANVAVVMSPPAGVSATNTTWNLSELVSGEEVILHSTVVFSAPENYVLNIEAVDDADHAAEGIVLINAYERPEPLVSLTGDYVDYPTDSDSDGVYDYLTIETTMVPKDPGNCVLRARLVDESGEEIVWTENIQWLEAGTPQTISLNFDGDAIFEHGINGPYFLRDVYVYHTGDPTRSDYVRDAHATAPYLYTQFGMVTTAAEIEFDPNTLNLKSLGTSVTCYIELEEGYDPAAIDVATVLFNGAVTALPAPTGVGDHDADGIEDRMVKFDRSKVIAFLVAAEESKAWLEEKHASVPALEDGQEVEVLVSGMLEDGTAFSGTDIIRVINPGGDSEDSAALEVFPTVVSTAATIEYKVASEGPVSLKVYDAAGRVVRTLFSGHVPVGRHSVMWDRRTDGGGRVSAGVYFVKLEGPRRVSVEKLLVVR
jgi:hypothetical protein